ncbi:shikimate kinase [bacterium]|nr:shikimate kinase [bacterium]
MIFLCGFMGCGKTEIGKLLAKKLNFNFLDLDEKITEKTSLTIHEIFEKLGEKGFRELETLVLENLLKNMPENSVFALGGGTLIFNFELVRKNGVLVYLKNDFETLWQRIEKTNRPLVKNGKKFCEELFEKRQPTYLKADFVFDCKGLTQKKAVDFLGQRLKKD